MDCIGYKEHCRSMPWEYTQCIFTLSIWWPVYFLKLGVSWLQHGYNSYRQQLKMTFFKWHTRLTVALWMHLLSARQFSDQAQLHQLTDYSWGQTYPIVLHSRLLNWSAVQFGIHTPDACETAATLSFEHHALSTCTPSLPMWVCMWNDLRDIWKACCLSS